MDLLITPQFILFSIAALMVLVSFFFRKQTVDIHVSDTYYIISRSRYFFVMASALIILGILYAALAQVITDPILTWMHISVTALSILATVIISFLQPVIRTQNDAGNIRAYATHNSWLVVTLMVLVFAQLALIINIALGIVRLIRK